MKHLSYNLSGAGRREKRKEVRELIHKGRIDFCCLQESKSNRVDHRIGKSIWGNNYFEMEVDLADGNAGGVISIWDREKFQKISVWTLKGLVVVNDIWLELGSRCTIVNVYASNTPSSRWELWNQIHIIAEQYREECLCIIGNFNAVWDVTERRGRGMYNDENDIENFNNFICDSDLVELHLIGRRFTWYRSDGTCKSKLDKMLVNASWCNTWPNQVLRGER